jgi:hypothetical protein
MINMLPAITMRAADLDLGRSQVTEEHTGGGAAYTAVYTPAF